MLRQAERKKAKVSKEPVQYNRTQHTGGKYLNEHKTSALEQEHSEQLIDPTSSFCALTR